MKKYERTVAASVFMRHIVLLNLFWLCFSILSSVFLIDSCFTRTPIHIYIFSKSKAHVTISRLSVIVGFYRCSSLCPILWFNWSIFLVMNMSISLFNGMGGMGGMASISKTLLSGQSVSFLYCAPIQRTTYQAQNK